MAGQVTISEAIVKAVADATDANYGRDAGTKIRKSMRTQISQSSTETATTQLGGCR